MKAARLYGVRDLRVEQIDDPTPGAGEALIRIEACGVCPSDCAATLAPRAGSGGRACRARPGTSGPAWSWSSGRRSTRATSAVGPDDERRARPISVGDRVVADWRYVLRPCYQCRRGVFNYCENLQPGVRGGFARLGIAPLSQLRRIPDNVSFEEASFTEPLACDPERPRLHRDRRRRRRGDRRGRPDRPAAPQMALQARRAR